MRRRNCLTICAGTALGAGGIGFETPSQAQISAPTPTPGEVRPYLQVKPVAGEGNVVRVFFSPGCSFSKGYFNFFKNLATTLPQPKRFAFSALVNRADGIGYALAFAAVDKYFPNHVVNFAEASLLGVLDRGLGASNWAAIERFGKAARLPVALPALVRSRQVQLMASVRAAIKRQTALGVTNTPAVAVAGVYVVTPEFTQGDATLFSQLVNGLISMA